MSNTQKIGTLGEDLVVRFLMKHGYKILGRNYRRPWGELDIVAERKRKIHFVEVKALKGEVSGETLPKEESFFETLSGHVSSETQREKSLRYIRSKVKKDRFRPEDNMNSNKLKRLSRIIQTYLMGKHVSDETTWQFDVATVLIDEVTKKAKIELLEELVL